MSLFGGKIAVLEDTRESICLTRKEWCSSEIGVIEIAVTTFFSTNLTADFA